MALEKQATLRKRLARNLLVVIWFEWMVGPLFGFRAKIYRFAERERKNSKDPRLYHVKTLTSAL